jgi:hypothetical protein
VKPRKCWSVIELATGCPFHSRRKRSGEPASSSVASPLANVHVSGDGCATVQALTRPTTSP